MWCLVKVSSLLKHLLHVSHWKDFTFVWVNSWTFKLLDVLNLLLQVLHLKCLFSSLWFDSWSFNFERSAKHLLQIVHWNGVLPVWILSCLFRLFFCLKHFSQVLHWNIFSVVVSTTLWSIILLEASFFSDWFKSWYCRSSKWLHLHNWTFHNLAHDYQNRFLYHHQQIHKIGFPSYSVGQKSDRLPYFIL